MGGVKPFQYSTYQWILALINRRLALNYHMESNLTFRSITDVPLKLREFKFIVSDSKAFHYMNAREWMEIQNVDDDISGVELNKMGAEFMMNPKTLYRIAFVGEQFQFTENSELQVCF